MKHVRGHVCALAIVLASASLHGASEPSFAGTWKLNLAKSQLTGQTMTIEKTSSGRLHFDSEGFSYDCDLSGKECPTPDGGTATWREENPNTWEIKILANGKVVVTIRMMLSGDSITSVASAPKPDGTTMEQTAKLSRLSGGPGFVGKWKSTEVKGTPTTLELALDGGDGITLRYPEFQSVCKGRFDGKDYPITSAGANLKQTLAFERTGARSFKMTTKLDGKLFYVDVMTLSPDGKTLTDEGNAVSVSEPVKSVYDRQ